MALGEALLWGGLDFFTNLFTRDYNKMTTDEEYFKKYEETHKESVVAPMTTEEEVYGRELPEEDVMQVVVDEIRPEPIPDSSLAIIDSGVKVEGGTTFTVKSEENNDVPINNSMLNEIVKNNNYRDKLFAAAILYCCKRISADQMGALISSINPEDEAVKENIEYVNSITRYFTGYNFAPNPIYKDKEFKLTEEQVQVARDVLALDLLSGNPVTSLIIEKLREWARNEGKLLIIFDNNKMDLFQNEAPKNVVRKVEDNFGELLKDYKHKISALRSGLIELSIARDTGIVESYLIDPGYVIGQDMKVLVKGAGDTDIYTSNKDILSKVFAGGYILTPEEVKSILVEEKQFYEQGLYLIYDFSNSKSIFEKSTRDDVDILESKLKMVKDITYRTFDTYCRFRIKNYKNVDSFIVVSDAKCKVPMGEMVATIIPGLVIKVNNNEISITLNDVNGNALYSNKYVLDKLELDMIQKYNMPVDWVLDQRATIA